MPKRRRRGNYPCNKRCHRMGCRYVAETLTNLWTHTNTVRYQCKHCSKDFSTKSYVSLHVQNQHPHFAPNYIRVRHRNPSGLQNHEWQFIKTCIHSCLRHDQTKVPQLKRSSAIIHKLAIQIAERIETDPTDDFGGLIKHGMVLRTHGGLFQLSLDRIVNHDVNGHCIHFPDIDNALANIRLVPLCINIAQHGHTITISDVQNRVKDAHSGVNRYTLSDYEGCCKTLVQSIFRRDPLARVCFGTWHSMWEWTMSRLERINCLCEISGILLMTNTPRSMWQMSIDAIDPIQGHVIGNMRIICRFLNCTNRAKDKNHHDSDDGPNAWTSELFCQYFRIP